ncbi:hypothetical protein ACOSQ3_017897 [Xanthoceras sorbifolium]
MYGEASFGGRSYCSKGSAGELVMSVAHALFWCSKSKSVWQDSMFGGLVADLKVCSGFDIVRWLSCQSTREDFEFLCILLWNLWFDRNLSMYNGIGVAVRDHCRHILAAVSLCFPGSFSAEVGEALALREGLLLAKDLGIGVRFVECDSVNVVNDVSSSALRLGVAGCVLDDIRALCKDVGVVSCQAISRKRNALAHTLAALACSLREDRFWFDVEPCCFSPLR